MQNKRIHLNFGDIAILTLIFFGTALYSSTSAFLTLLSDNQVMPEHLDFGAQNNVWGMVSECVCLLLAFAYLMWRKFDFKALNFQFNVKMLPRIVLYVLLAGTVAMVFEYVLMWLCPQLYPAPNEAATYSGEAHLNQWSVSLFAFALLNGFFEELFFLGLLFAVQAKHLPWAMLLGLVVRFAFHTYQGLAGALTITTLGVVFLLLRFKHKELLPFMLAHSFFDVFGLGLPLYLLD